MGIFFPLIPAFAQDNSRRLSSTGASFVATMNVSCAIWGGIGARCGCSLLVRWCKQKMLTTASRCRSTHAITVALQFELNERERCKRDTSHLSHALPCPRRSGFSLVHDTVFGIYFLSLLIRSVCRVLDLIRIGRQTGPPSMKHRGRNPKFGHSSSMDKSTRYPSLLKTLIYTPYIYVYAILVLPYATRIVLRTQILHGETSNISLWKTRPDNLYQVCRTHILQKNASLCVHAVDVRKVFPRL